MYRYHITQRQLHGLEVFEITLKRDGVLLAASTHFSKEYAVTWAQVTYRKLIQQNREKVA